MRTGYPNRKTCRLLAMDMDGTALNSEKQVSPRTKTAVEAALAAGRHVLFATGRCPAEVREYLALFPGMRYAVYLSGALVRDEKTGRALLDCPFPRPLAEQVLDVLGRC